MLQFNLFMFKCLWFGLWEECFDLDSKAFLHVCFSFNVEREMQGQEELQGRNT